MSLDLLFGLRFGAVPAPAEVPAREFHVWADVEARLNATGRFELVEIAEPADVTNEVAADRIPAAIITPLSGEEMDFADDTDDVRNDATSVFNLTLIVRSTEPRERFDLLDQLRSAVQNAINGKSLANLTVPAFTRVRRWQYQPAKDPEKRLVLTVEFRYIVAGHDDHDESDFDYGD